MDAGETQRLSRVVRLIGPDATEALREIKVAVFGIGGVGSWAAEALVRSGVRHILIVDADSVARSNINRQLIATELTVGKPKVDVLRSRLLEIAPEAVVDTRCCRYTAENAHRFNFDEYDYVVDAIDSLSDKACLILRATASHCRLFSSMGAAMKLDPSRIGVAEFWKVKGCPLAAALRRKFKKSGVMPGRKFKCVFSDELVPNRGENLDSSGAMSFDKVAFNGAMCHITAIFGMTLASLVVRDVVSRL